MFILASCGRSGTFAVCTGLNTYSDHIVAHEPEPLLLEEAFLKHTGQEYRTRTFNSRLAYFQEKSGEKYGESFRAPNLLPEIYAVVPEAKFLILARNPIEYVFSANAKRVFQKNDIWDQTRLVPLAFGKKFSELPLAEKIAWHWVIANDYLLQFIRRDEPNIKLAILSNLERQIFEIADFLEVRITQPDELKSFLAKRPNAAESYPSPVGFTQKQIEYITQPTWTKLTQIATLK